MCSLLYVHYDGDRPNKAMVLFEPITVMRHRGNREYIDHNCSAWLVSKVRRECVCACETGSQTGCEDGVRPGVQSKYRKIIFTVQMQSDRRGN